MIQVIARPTPISFSKNPIVYRFRAVDDGTQLPFRAYGARAGCAVSAGFQFQDGDTLTLNFTEASGSETTVVFTAKDTLTLDTHLPTATPLSTVAQYIAAHRLVAPHINVYLTSRQIFETLTAESRRVEANWTISFAIAIQDPNIVTNTTTTPYADNTAPDNYAIEYEVFFETEFNTRKWQRVHRGALRNRDDGGDIYLNLSDVLESECGRHLKENPFRSVNLNGNSIADNVRRFYIRYRESSVSFMGNWTTEATQKLITGGVPNTLWLSRNWFSFTTDDLARTWLTYKPNFEKVRLDCTTWLSWYNLLEETTDVQLEVEWSDNHSAGNMLIVTNSRATIDAGHSLTFALTPSVLGLYNGVKHYKIRVVSVANNTPLSTWRDYIVDTMPQRNNRTLAYINSFGCPETVICTGEFSKNLSYQTATTEAVRGVNNGGSITRTERSSFGIGIGYTYRTGYRNAAEREALSEVTLSAVLFDISTSRYLALVLKAERSAATTDIFFNSDEKMYAIEWQTELKIGIGTWGTDAAIRGGNTLVEPIMALQRAGSSDAPLPDFVGDDTRMEEGGGEMTELGELRESDLIVFARLGLNGEVAGFYTFQNGKYKRLIRGISATATSHLDGITLTNPNGGTVKLTIDEAGQPDFHKQ